MMKGYEQKKYPVATKRYVQWLELESDEEAIREYRRLHSEGVQWKEIRDGIRQVGILEMEIYIFGNRLVMVVDAPVDFDWDNLCGLNQIRRYVIKTSHINDHHISNLLP